jgi:hypothetical protein
VILIILLSTTALAQTTSPTFGEFVVELWPEYDQPSVLVIYRANLNDDIPLPATLTFRLPAHVEDVHAIAVERDGGLFNLDPGAIQQTRTDDELLLTLTVDEPNIHLEYYDSEILLKDAQTRQFDYTFQVDYPVETVRFQVQTPLEATDFSLSPAPTSTFTDNRQLTYQIIETTDVVEGEPVNISGTYSRDTDTPSAQLLQAPTTAPSTDIQVVTDEAVDGFELSPGYLLIGIGLLLLMVTGGYWWWSNHRQPQQPSSRAGGPAPRRSARQRKRAANRKTSQPATKTQNSGYCYQCGTALRGDANFCHVCGAERRGNS